MYESTVREYTARDKVFNRCLPKSSVFNISNVRTLLFTPLYKIVFTSRLSSQVLKLSHFSSNSLTSLSMFPLPFRSPF